VAGRIAHALGNVFLGVALGLLAYYGITDILADRAQADLERQLGGLGAIAEASPSVAETESVSGDPWLDWDAQDLRYWEDLQSGDVFGRLVIEDLDLDTVVLKGTTREDLKRGPGWIAETDPPGPTGNCAISGHRTTYGAPFRHVDSLETSDTIQFYSPYRRYTYEVTEQRVVRPWQTEVIASTEEPMLTLTACHPPYSAAYRIIIHAALIDVRLLEGETPGTDDR
jgi:sortase A